MPDRIVIGSETNDERKIELEEAGSKYSVPVSILNSSGDSIPIASGLVTEAYDNIDLSYTGSNLTGVVYKDGVTTVATLTLDYNTSNQLITIVKT